MGVQRFAEGGDVAMAENGPDTGEQRLARVSLLRGEVADQRLRGGEADRSHVSLRGGIVGGSGLWRNR